MPFRGVRSDTFVTPHSSRLRSIPCKGDRSDTFVVSQYSQVRGIPCKGDRSDTWVLLQCRSDNDMPFSGERASSFPELLVTTRIVSFVNARTGAMFVTWSVENVSSASTP